MSNNYTYITDKEEMKKYKYDYEYIVFKDEVGEILVIPAKLEKECLFGGMIGKITELERGIILKPEDGNYLKAVFDKKHEYEQKIEQLNQEDKLKFQLLHELSSDCDYYLKGGDKSVIGTHDKQELINRIKELWSSFANNKKPEWITWEDILNYEKLMLN